MIKEAIILAGGKGTRLQSVINDKPKPMALVAGKPFITYLLDFLILNKVEKVILSVGFKHESIVEYLSDNYKGLNICYAIENKPLGTGGAIVYASQYLENKNFFLLNGDSFFNIDLLKLEAFHVSNKNDFTIAVKPMKNFDRYGTVEVENNKILRFKEKRYCEFGFINAGVYLIDKSKINTLNFPENFSFEKDFLEAYTNDFFFGAYIDDKYFIDIGIPEDYKLAQKELIPFFNHLE